MEVETDVGPLLLPRGDQVITRVLADLGTWERAEGTWLASQLRPGHTFVDVGAHVGYFSVLASNLVGPEGTVIALEPEKRNLDLLRRNLVRNGCTNSLVLPFAAYSSSGELSLQLDERNRGAHRLVPLGEAPTTVRCVRLDDVLPAKVDLVKVDAQGYDHDIVEGLERTVTANPELMIMTELSPEELELRGAHPASVLAGYEALGFKLSIPGGPAHSRRMSVAEALALCLVRRPATTTVILGCRIESGGSMPLTGPFRAEGLEVNAAQDGLLVVQPARNRAHRLSDSAATIFELCTGHNPVARIVELVQQAYGLPEPPYAEVGRCLADLRREALIT